MLTGRMQEVTDQAVTQHLAILKDIILTGTEESVALATLQLALTGKDQAAEMLLEMIRDTEPKNLGHKVFLISALMHMPSRDKHREELKKLFDDDELIEALYSNAEDLDQRLFEAPLHLLVAEALEAEFARQLRTAERAAENGILYAD